MEKFLWMAKHIRPIKAEKVRFGNNCDGGYVLPTNCLESSNLCVSYGLGNNVTFENDIIKRGISVIGFDMHAKRHLAWARQKTLECYQDFSNLEEISNSKNIILKVDVEGSEWNFFNTLDSKHFSDHVSCFAFELHFHMNPKKMPLSVMEKMFDSHYVVHVHGNNYGHVDGMVPVAIEITLANKKHFDNSQIDRQKYPIKDLDYSNNSGARDLSLAWLSAIKLL